MLCKIKTRFFFFLMRELLVLSFSSFFLKKTNMEVGIPTHDDEESAAS